MDKIPPLYKAMGLASNVVYLREVAMDDLPDEVQAQLESDRPIFAVYHEDGEQIALIESPSLAKDLAKEHDFELHQVN